jgi:alanyl-tRNA synthetase
MEVATLVFMQYKVIDDKFVKLPIRTVDTGYGIDRYAWVSQGALSGFHAIYGSILDKIFNMAGLTKIDTKLLARIAAVSGLVNLDKTASRLETRKKEAELVGMNVAELDKFLIPIENAFAVADHTKSLSFILSEGVVPSNIQEGYLARLLFRRIYRLLRMLGIPDKLYDIVEMQIDYWSKDFPQLKQMEREITEMLKVEEEKFEDTIKRGEGMVKRIVNELGEKHLERMGKRKPIGKLILQETMPVNELSELYDSHGLPPEIVKEFAEKEGLRVEIPDDFYALIAQRHFQTTKKTEEEDQSIEHLRNAVSNLPETNSLYYEDQYMREFEAKVIKTVGDCVVLDQTCFFPEGGGQPADSGRLMFDGKEAEVIDVQKLGKVIVHKVKGSVPKENVKIKGVLDWEKRYSLMKNHTATHVIGGAAKRVLGLHVWQFGTQKGVESSRLDISHYRRLSLEEIQKIEVLANEAIQRNIHVDIEWMPRNEAESRYGFRLYQGGAVPGKEIRVVRAGDWDVEACAGTHLRNTGELGFIKIIHSERVQDGVERLTYSVGIPAVKAVQQNERILMRVSDTLTAPIEKLDKTAEKIVKELKEANAEKRKLLKELAKRESTGVTERKNEEAETIDGIRLVKRDFREEIDIERMVQTANEMIKKDESTVTIFYGSDGKNARIMVMVGKDAVEKGVDAAEIVKQTSTILGGGGGGRPNFAQGGGTQTLKLLNAVKKAEDMIKERSRNSSAR